MTAPSASTPADLLTSLSAALPKALPMTLTTHGPKPTAGNDLYEAYLLGLVLRAARNESYTTEFRDAAGYAATSFNLRRSPGRLASAGPPGSRFTHVVLTAPGRPALELHAGVMVTGRSKVAHEADVLLVTQAAADRCRMLNLDPSSSEAELIIEAKYYTMPVRLATGREFLGLNSDLSAKVKVFAATIVGSSVRNLFAGRRLNADHGVLPRKRGEHALLALLQRVLRDYRYRL